MKKYFIAAIVILVIGGHINAPIEELFSGVIEIALLLFVLVVAIKAVCCSYPYHYDYK